MSKCIQIRSVLCRHYCQCGCPHHHHLLHRHNHNHLCIHHESSLHIQTEKVASGINLAMYGKNRQNTEENKQVGQNHKTLKTITDQRPFLVSGGFTR